MAEIQENNSGKGKEGKGKQKKMTIRVDFTPMVDMNMLLITFFMLCTSLSKPQTMEISMPTKDTQEDMQTKVAASRAITLLLGEDDKVYYYLGEPNYQDYTSLKETTYTPDGLRAVLLARNANVVARINELKKRSWTERSPKRSSRRSPPRSRKTRTLPSFRSREPTSRPIKT